jgi:hypothetical protein
MGFSCPGPGWDFEIRKVPSGGAMSERRVGWIWSWRRSDYLDLSWFGLWLWGKLGRGPLFLPQLVNDSLVEISG